MDLTKAGENLGVYLRDNDVPHKGNIYSFIERFSVKCRELNESLEGSRHKPFVFQLMRKFYLDLVSEKYGEKLSQKLSQKQVDIVFCKKTEHYIDK
jgi:hypothetical protein